MQRWDKEFEQRLLAANDYRSFLKAFFEKSDRAQPKPLSFAQFSARAGFSSRSFMNDVLAGRKRLGPASFEPTARGLGLNAGWKGYFRSILAKDLSAFCPANMSPESCLAAFDRHREKIRKRLDRLDLSPSATIARVLLEPDYPDIYAALGSIEQGATLSEVGMRTGLAPKRIQLMLEKMEDAGLVRPAENDRYLPLAAALDLSDIGQDEIFLADAKRALARARSRLAGQAQSTEALFMTQTFSVSRRNLPRLRAQLADIVRNLAADNENHAGDTVSEIFVSLTSPSRA